jgi:hypothetical protein
LIFKTTKIKLFLKELNHGIFHDAMWNAFVSIAKNGKFHILCEQIHVLPQLALQFL